FVAELEARIAESLNLCFEVVHLDLNPVPSAGDGLTTVGHGPASGAGLSAEQEPHPVTADRCEDRASVQVEREAEVCRVEFDGSGNVVDHVANTNRRHGLAYLLMGVLPRLRVVGRCLTVTSGGDAKAKQDCRQN